MRSKREICGFIFIKDELGEDVLCEVGYEEEFADFIAEVEFDSGNKIIAGINDTDSTNISDKMLAAIKNQLESQHAIEPRLVGMICGQESNYILYANMKYSKQLPTGAVETFAGDYYLADVIEE